MAFDDLDDFLDLDMGAVPVIAGAVTGLGYLDLNGEMIFEDRVMVFDYVLTAQFGKFGNLDYPSTISVDDKSFLVKMRAQPYQDGAFCKIPLAKVDALGPFTVILDGDPSDDPEPTSTELPTLILDGNP